jgi:hypothetical protein
VPFFNKIRKDEIKADGLKRYMLYAVGEIVLVVLGILIALQIDNWNDIRKERLQELKYLENIQSDILSEITNNKQMKDLRQKKAGAASEMLFRKNPVGIDEIVELEKTWILVYFWTTYIPKNNVFKELSSSGHLNEITNDSIKFYLLDLDKRYTDIHHLEQHMRREYEEYLYDPAIHNTELLNFYDFKNMTLREKEKIIDTTNVKPTNLKSLQSEYKWLLTTKVIRNGLKLAAMNNMVLGRKHLAIEKKLERLVELLKTEVNGKP